MGQKLGWGIMGAGGIARTFATGVLKSETGELIAIGSRSREKADKFGDEFKIPHRHASYEALLADKDVQAVYIATPHPLHAEWSIRAAEAGKHVLCEKPMAMNHAEAMVVIEAAKEHDVFFMEAFMYRCHPYVAKVLELIRQKALGEIKVIQATFSFRCGFNLESRLLAKKLGGGGIMDVGCYATSISNLIAGAANGKDFIEPWEVKGAGFVGPVSGVDEWAVATVRYPGNVVAQIASGVQLNQENVVRIFGTDGMITLPTPWIPAKDGGTTRIIYQKYWEKPEEIVVECAQHLYALEVDEVGRHIKERQATPPAMTYEDSLANLKTMDLWRESIGMTYDTEKWDNCPTVHRRPLAVRKSAPMAHGRIAGLEKSVSRLVMGADNQRTIAHASAIFDDYFEFGGNVFDSAHIYGGGHSERVLGQYVKNRGIREQIVLLSKGAHTPECNPAGLTRHLKETLSRLQTDYTDIYMMHRDNPEIPVGEFAEVLNEHVRAGRMKIFGGSNWSIERVEAFNAYAKSKGLQGMSAVSNNFSLARMVDPVWPGCIAASDPKSRAWFTKTQLPLMPWSSQARGFFTERAHPENRSDQEMVRCWYSEDNWKRRERVIEMAKKRNVLPINIALAYVLCQPFPTFPLIGPRVISELRTSLPALGITLTPGEMRWLNLED